MQSGGDSIMESESGMTVNNQTLPPLARFIWQRGRGWCFSAGEARYYGWRFMVCCGPLTVCLLPCEP
jgi:hypothetical protein